MSKVYTVNFTPAGLAYVRAALGRCPYDEAGPLIQDIEVQRMQQDQPPPPAEPDPALPPA